MNNKIIIKGSEIVIHEKITRKIKNITFSGLFLLIAFIFFYKNNIIQKENFPIFLLLLPLIIFFIKSIIGLLKNENIVLNNKLKLIKTGSRLIPYSSIDYIYLEAEEIFNNQTTYFTLSLKIKNSSSIEIQKSLDDPSQILETANAIAKHLDKELKVLINNW